MQFLFLISNQENQNFFSTSFPNYYRNELALTRFSFSSIVISLMHFHLVFHSTIYFLLKLFWLLLIREIWFFKNRTDVKNNIYYLIYTLLYYLYMLDTSTTFAFTNQHNENVFPFLPLNNYT